MWYRSAITWPSRSPAGPDLRSGVPSVPVPHLFDQYYWAGRLHEIGVAPKPVFRHDLEPKRLARRIEQAYALEPAAKAAGEQVRAERGVELALDAIEALIA